MVVRDSCARSAGCTAASGACLPPGFFCCVAGVKMVKLGNNFSEKNGGKAVSEDGFDTIPLITPLDASQLQFPPPEKVRDSRVCPLIRRQLRDWSLSAHLLSHFYSVNRD